MDDILQKAFQEMLQGCLDHPEHWVWYVIWRIEKKDGSQIGDLSFKGVHDDGSAETGYGIDEAYQGQGYATELADAAVMWTLQQPDVPCAVAETESEKRAAQRTRKMRIHPIRD